MIAPSDNPVSPFSWAMPWTSSWHTLCGSSNCLWDPLNQGTDVKLESWNLFHSPLTAHLEEISSLSHRFTLWFCPKKEFRMHLLCLNAMIVICFWNLFYYCLFHSYWVTEELFCLAVPISPSLTQEQSKLLYMGPAAYECSYPEASVSTAFQGLDPHFPSQGSESQTESRWLLMHPLTWKKFMWVPSISILIPSLHLIDL